MQESRRAKKREQALRDLLSGFPFVPLPPSCCSPGARVGGGYLPARRSPALSKDNAAFRGRGSARLSRRRTFRGKAQKKRTTCRHLQASWTRFDVRFQSEQTKKRSHFSVCARTKRSSLPQGGGAERKFARMKLIFTLLRFLLRQMFLRTTLQKKRKNVDEGHSSGEYRVRCHTRLRSGVTSLPPCFHRLNSLEIP